MQTRSPVLDSGIQIQDSVSRPITRTARARNAALPKDFLHATKKNLGTNFSRLKQKIVYLSVDFHSDRLLLQPAGRFLSNQ
jgi:hypothetical protein